MNNKTLQQLMDLCKYADSQSSILEDVGITCEALDSISDILHDIILTSYGIPEDTTLENEFDNEELFSRDYWNDVLYDYEQGKIGIDDLIEELEGCQGDTSDINVDNKILVNKNEIKSLSYLLHRAYRFTDGGPNPQLTEDLLKAKQDLDKIID